MNRFLCASAVSAVRLTPDMKSNKALLPACVELTGYNSTSEKEVFLKRPHGRVQYGRIGDWYVIFPWGQVQLVHDDVFKTAFVQVDEIKPTEFSNAALKKIKKALAWFSNRTGWGA